MKGSLGYPVASGREQTLPCPAQQGGAGSVGPDSLSSIASAAPWQDLPNHQAHGPGLAGGGQATGLEEAEDTEPGARGPPA